MKKTFLFAICLLLIALISGCGDSDHGSVPLPPGVERTVLVYWVADNVSGNELTDYAISDFKEMVEGMASVDVEKNNLLVYIETKYDDPHLIRVTELNNKIIADTIVSYPEQNPLSKVVMENVITRVITDYPAKSYGLILASHADGWMEAPNSATRHWGDYRGSQMNIPDLCAALACFPHLDFILFDACYMQAIEVAYELKDCTDYIIASPTEIPAPGAPYQNVIPAVFSDSESLAVNIGRAYYDYYGTEDGEILDAQYRIGSSVRPWTYGVSISVIKTSKLEEFAVKTQGIISNYVAEDEVVPTYSLFYYGSTYPQRYYYYDMVQFIAQLTGKNADYESWKELFDKMQIYFHTTKTNYANRVGGTLDMNGASGISVYVPKDRGSVHAYYQTLKWYEASGWIQTGW